MNLQGISNKDVMKAFEQSGNSMEENDFIEKFTELVSLKIKDTQEYDAEMINNTAKKYVKHAESVGISLDSMYLFSCLSEFVQKNVTLFK